MAKVTLSDFEMLKEGNDNGGFSSRSYAEVLVTTKRFFKTTFERRKIFKQWGTWRYLDDGEITPNSQAENLERCYYANKELNG